MPALLGTRSITASVRPFASPAEDVELSRNLEWVPDTATCTPVAWEDDDDDDDEEALEDEDDLDLGDEDEDFFDDDEDDDEVDGDEEDLEDE